MITLRQRVFIITGIVLAILLVILLYLLYGRKYSTANETASTETSQNAALPTTNGTPPKTVGQQPAPAKPMIALPAYSEDLYLRQLAKIFVERFASYSTQNDNNNITDSLDLATSGMQIWMNAQMKPDSRDYEGAVTEVLASSVKEKTPATATVAIQIQQSFQQKKATAVGATTTEIRRKKGTVKLVKVGDQWKIDALFWE